MNKKLIPVRARVAPRGRRRLRPVRRRRRPQRQCAGTRARRGCRRADDRGSPAGGRESARSGDRRQARRERPRSAPRQHRRTHAVRLHQRREARSVLLQHVRRAVAAGHRRRGLDGRPGARRRHLRHHRPGGRLLQLVAGKWPLYTYGGDAAPGDVTGQGSGGVWFAVGVDGKLISGDAPAGDPATTVESTVPADPYAGGYEYPSTDSVPEAPATSQAPAAPASCRWARPGSATRSSMPRADALRLHQRRRRRADVRRRLRRRVAAAARRRRGASGRTRPGGVLGRCPRRRISSAQGRRVAAVPLRR